MNQAFRQKMSPLRSKDLPLTTQAAEGLLRRRWNIAEIEKATELGIFGEHERFELIGGEIVPMNSKGIQHEVLKSGLVVYFSRNLPDGIWFSPETTFRLSDDTFIEPDFVFFRKADGLANLRPQTALLAVEVSDTSLGWDLGRKALLYAHFGIPELWVIDALKQVTHVHTQPGPEGYRDIKKVTAAKSVTSASISGLTLTLATLERF